MDNEKFGTCSNQRVWTHKVSFQEITISFWLPLVLWSCQYLLQFICLRDVKNNLQFWLKSSKIKISQQQFEYALHLNNESCGYCAVFAQNDFLGRYLPNTFSNLINEEQLLSSEYNRSSKQTCRWDFFLILLIEKGKVGGIFWLLGEEGIGGKNFPKW